MRRFTPIQIKSIQSQLFHDRQQKQNETVDEYAEALRKLFSRAYSNLSGATETMGQSVLANQFVAGLCPELKAKVVGAEGNMEQLLIKARFEEAKRKDLAMVATSHSQKRYKGGEYEATPISQAVTTGTENKGKWSGRMDTVMKNCFNCGLASHLVRDCPYP